MLFLFYYLLVRNKNIFNSIQYYILWRQILSWHQTNHLWGDVHDKIFWCPFFIDCLTFRVNFASYLLCSFWQIVYAAPSFWMLLWVQAHSHIRANVGQCHYDWQLAHPIRSAQHKKKLAHIIMSYKIVWDKFCIIMLHIFTEMLFLFIFNILPLILIG